jgi:hypothetical protein
MDNEDKWIKGKQEEMLFFLSICPFIRLSTFPLDGPLE